MRVDPETFELSARWRRWCADRDLPHFNPPAPTLRTKLGVVLLAQRDEPARPVSKSSQIRPPVGYQPCRKRRWPMGLRPRGPFACRGCCATGPTRLSAIERTAPDAWISLAYGMAPSATTSPRKSYISSSDVGASKVALTRRPAWSMCQRIGMRPTIRDLPMEIK